MLTPKEIMEAVATRVEAGATTNAALCEALKGRATQRQVDRALQALRRLSRIEKCRLEDGRAAWRAAKKLHVPA